MWLIYISHRYMYILCTNELNCMSEHVVLVISSQSWQYCNWQGLVKMAVLMLYLNTLYLMIHSRI
jgi:hypothetical protein